MAFPQLGPFGKIVEDFKKSLQNIFGTSEGSKASSKLTAARNLLKSIGQPLESSNWTGNTNRQGGKKLRYGFRVVELNVLANGKLAIGSANSNSLNLSKEYYLDIPPQAITQKENFATNIQATRRGVIVETEGVVFKDIVIQGTTGVYPGKRDSYGQDRANFSDLTKKPERASGVSKKDGISDAGEVISGYAEFLALRAFFINYSEEKVNKRGSIFLVFINEKDQQALLVEPLEFVMERNSKAPLQYQYRIVLKCIGSLDAAFNQLGETGDKNPPDLTLEDILNVAANASAAIQQFRAAVGSTNQLVQSISQEIDKTFINPLRLLGAALKDVAEGRKNILTSSAALRRNLNESLLSIEEARFDKTIGNLIKDIKLTNTINSAQVSSSVVSASSGTVTQGLFSKRGVTDKVTSAKLLSGAQAENFIRTSVLALEQAAQEPLPRAFVEDLRNQAVELLNDLADAVNLGNADYNSIVNRVPTIKANPLKIATTNEYLLLGATQGLISALNQVLSTNSLFQQSIENDFESRQELLKNIFNAQAPTTVREIIIQQGDTLEKISLRTYGTVSRWPDLVILNNLKFPYIAETRSDGVKIPGDKLLVGN
jgi:nucleoid-associated protein YgaU